MIVLNNTLMTLIYENLYFRFYRPLKSIDVIIIWIYPKMGRLILLTIAIIAFAIVVGGQTNTTADECAGKPWGQAGQFDFYVFEQSWPAQFCNGKTFPGCKNPTDFMRTRLTIHGLWPNYNKSDQGHMWPQCCQSAYGPNVNPQVVKQYMNDLQTYWPNEQDPNPASPYSNTLWQHEWAKHGTCAGSEQATYFSSTMKAVYPQMQTPQVLMKNVGGQVSKSELVRSFSKIVKTQCASGYLSSIQSCFNKNYVQIDCPASGGQDTCTGATINIRKFP